MDRGSDDLDLPRRAADDHTAGGRAGDPAPGAGAPGTRGGELLPARRSPGAEPAAPGADTGAPALPPAGRDPRGVPVRIVSGDLLVRVNPVDGSEIEPCPPAEGPPRPVRLSADERAERARAARPPLPPGPAAHRPPLPARQEERGRLARLLSRGRSVRLTAAPGSGRSTLLDAVAEDCAHLAPDGVIRLSGHRRTVRDVLYDLCFAVYHSPLHRPGDALLRELVADIGAVVVLDDLEFGGAALDDLLDATPECAFLFATTPDAPEPSADAHLEEVALPGLDRGDAMDLLRLTVGRDLTDEETAWAADLFFAAEGLPVRFVQAGALLRRRDQLHAEAAQQAFDPQAPGAARQPLMPLPSLAEGAAPVALLASLLSGSARSALRFAVALGGELPHRSQLPALLADPGADTALAELLSTGLLTPVGARYRLAAGVRTQLEAAGFGDDAAERARTAGEHYVWWTGHRSIPPERVLAESDAVLATLAALVALVDETSAPFGGPGGTDAGRSLAVHLARTAAPVFAAALDWGVWERALRSGQEAARRAGEVGEEAYFHHELGVLALCAGRFDRASAELEASIGLRGVLADKRGTVAGRRALALVADRSGIAAQPGAPAAPAPGQRPDPAGPAEPADSFGTPPLGVQTSFGAGLAAPQDPPTARLRAVPPADDPTARLPAGAAEAAGGTADGGGFDLSAAPGRLGSGGAGGGHGFGGGADGAAGDGAPATLVSRAPGRAADASAGRADHRHAAARNTRRNVAAAAGGALLAAVLGTVVTLGATSDHDEPSDKVGPDPSVSQDDGDGFTADEPGSGGAGSADPSPSGSSGSPSASTSESPTSSRSGTVPGAGGASQHTSSPTGGSSRHHTTRPPTHKPTTKPPTSTPPTSDPPPTSPTTSPSDSPPDDPGSPDSSDSAAGPPPTADPTATLSGSAAPTVA